MNAIIHLFIPSFLFIYLFTCLWKYLWKTKGNMLCTTRNKDKLYAETCLNAFIWNTFSECPTELSTSTNTKLNSGYSSYRTPITNHQSYLQPTLFCHHYFLFCYWWNPSTLSFKSETSALSASSPYFCNQLLIISPSPYSLIISHLALLR